MSDIITDRNNFLNSITDTDFPTDVQILSAEDSVNEAGYTTITVDRNLDWEDKNRIIIRNTTSYNGTHKLKYVDNGSNKFDIEVAYVATETGDIKGTSHRYKDNVYEIKNFPAIGLGVDEIVIDSDSKSSATGFEYNYWYFVVDRIDSYGDKEDSDSTEACQQYVCSKGLSILEQVAGEQGKIKINIESLVPFEHIINEVGVSVLMGKLTIYPRN